MTKQQEEKVAEVLRQELGMFSIRELDEFVETIDNLDDAKRKAWQGDIDAIKKTLYKLLKYAYWSHFKSLGEFQNDPRMQDIIRGGINAISVLKEYVDKAVAEHEENLKGDERPVYPYNPLPE